MTLLQLSSDSISTESFSAIIKLVQKFSIRFLIDIVSVFILVRFVYFKVYKRSDLFFTFFVFNIVIFLICFLLNKVDLSMGAAFGLFAVFSMLRYRTEDISIKDMTYLFLVIAIGLIAAVTKVKDTLDVYEYLFLGFVNAIIIIVAFLFDTGVLFKKEIVKLINYENIELIKKENHAELIADIKNRTGINIHRVTIGKIDFLKDSAQIKVYYYED